MLREPDIVALRWDGEHSVKAARSAIAARRELAQSIEEIKTREALKCMGRSPLNWRI